MDTRKTKYIKVPFGSLEERKGAKGTTYKTVYIDPLTKKRTSKTFSEEKHARQYLTETENAIKLDYWKPENLEEQKERAKIRIPKFKDYAEQWLETKQNGISGEVSIATIRRYKSRLKNFLLPEFGKLYLHEITVKAVNEFYLKQKTDKRHVYGLLKQIMTSASTPAIDGVVYIKQNPCIIKVKKPERQKTPILLSWEELKSLALAMTPELRISILIMGTMGLRNGEIRGLKLKHIDWENGTINVIEQLQKQDRGGEGAKLKSDSRKMKMAQIVKDELLTHLILFNDYFIKNDPEQYLLRSRQGKSMNETSYYKAFNEAKIKAGLSEKLTPHDLRHTAITGLASAVLAVGATQADLMYLMGDRTPKMAEVYIQQQVKKQTDIFKNVDKEIFKEEQRIYKDYLDKIISNPNPDLFKIIEEQQLEIEGLRREINDLKAQLENDGQGINSGVQKMFYEDVLLTQDFEQQQENNERFNKVYIAHPLLRPILKPKD